MKIRIKTPARLHLGLIDLNGDMGRLFGGLGVAIDHPNVILEAEAFEKLVVTGQQIQLTTSLANQFFKAYPAKTCAALNVNQAIPAHMGLGSGTQLALAVGTALARVCGMKISTPQLAITMGRVRRTGVGTAVFDQGGLVVDGGKARKNRVCVRENFPPLIFRQPFPENWRFIVVLPNVKQGLTSEEEALAFSKLPPMLAEDVGRACRLTMMKLLPALAEQDIENFGDALTDIQIISGNHFAAVQGGTYASTASTECIVFMRLLGIHGVGQSSWGPALYGVVEEKEARQNLAKIRAYLKTTVGGEAFIAKPNNRGASIKIYK